MPMNKSDIINEINKLTAELPLVKKVAEISEHEGLEIAFNELTEKCCARVKSRNYKDSLEAHLFHNNIPTSVYYNLVEVAGNNNDALKRYIKLRK